MELRVLKKFTNFERPISYLSFRPMSMVPSFNQILDQSDPAPDAAAALQALLVVSPDGRIQFATARANLWLRDLFAAAYPLDRLPEALTRWLCDGISGGQRPRFIVDQSGERLGVQFLCCETDSVCLLLERSPEVSANRAVRSALTERQTEVLSWVARGKTNAEIGKILSLKTKTIGKYLERIFPKLGVENRTAAASFVLRANGVI